jgi:hypothetical protein
MKTAAATSLAFILALCSGSAQDRDIEKHIGRLAERMGAEDPMERAKATDEMTALGRRMIEALRAYQRKSDDPEVRARIATVLSALSQSTVVTRETLRTIPCNIAMQEGTLANLLSMVTTKTGIQFLIQFDEENYIGGLEDIDVRGASIEALLDMITVDYDLKWDIDGEGRVFIMPINDYYKKMAENRVFDLTALLTRPPDHGEQYKGQEGWITAEEIEEIIRASIEPDTWDLDGPQLNYYENRLHVRHGPRVLRQIDRLIADLESRFIRTFRIEFLAVSCDREHLESWIGSDSREPSAKQIQAIVTKVKEGRDAKRFATLRLTAALGQAVKGTHVEQATYVTGFRAEKAGEQVLVVPETTQVKEGLTVLLRPGLSKDERRMRLEIELELTKVLSVETVKQTAGTLRLPTVASMELKHTAMMEQNRWSLSGILTPTSEPDRRYVILCRVTPAATR